MRSWWVLSVVLVSCAPPSPAPIAESPCWGEGAPLFEDLTARSGIRHVSAPLAKGDAYTRSLGGGAALDDLDGDGDLDLYVSNANGPNALFLGDGAGRFVEAAAERGVAFPDAQTVGVAAADVDDDGDEDLLLLARTGARLLLNDGAGHFTPTSFGAEVPVTATSAAFGDVDGDGDLDLAISASARRYPWHGGLVAPFLAENLGQGRFRAVPLPDAGIGSGYVAVLQDLDDDGRADLIFPQEFSYLARHQVLRSSGPWQFEDTYTEAIWGPGAVMGGAFVDPNGDGRPDLFLTNLASVPPYHESIWANLGGGRFTLDDARGAQAVDTRGDTSRGVSWGAAAFDRDNDGDDDLYIVYGGMEEDEDVTLPWMTAARTPNAFLTHADGRYSVEGGTCSEDLGRGRGVVAGDLDGDGCVDLVVINLGAPVRVLRNTCARPGLELRLVGRAGRPNVVGARVDVRVGEQRQTKWVTAGSLVLHGSNPRRLYFGLGDAPQAEVHVRWPGGAETRTTLAPGVHRLVAP